MDNADWTWMIYLATHNDAVEVGEASVARMQRAVLNDRVRVLVQQATPARTVRRAIDMAMPDTDLGPIDSGAPETLLDFISWAAKTAPARRYALVLWSHGSGWEPREIERMAQQNPATVPVTPGELQQRGPEDSGGQVFFSSTLRELITRPTPSERAIARDDGSGHSLDTLELGRVVAQAARSLGRPLDFVGMNACQMSCAEVAYQLRGNAEVYVASAEDMPAEGWPFDDLLTRLAAAPDMDAAALGQLVVERYCATFREIGLPWGTEGLPNGVTLTALKLDGIPLLASAAGALANTLREHIGELSDVIWAAHRKAHKFKFQLYDLASFCHVLATEPGADLAGESARAVLAALANPALTLASDHVGAAYATVGGLTTYLLPPGAGLPISPYYTSTAYAKNTGWGDFLAAYHASVG